MENAEKKLRLIFILGVIVDTCIALSWFLIAGGLEIPNIMTGYTGSGESYQMAMYIAGMFMTGWAVILAYGAFKPVERKGLLLITAAFLTLSVIIEALLYGQMLGPLSTVGAAKRIILSGLCSYGYFKAE